MLRVGLKGLSEGSNKMELRCAASEVCGSFPEFVDEVVVQVDALRVGRRVYLQCSASCDVALTCDYSLQDFRETINAEFRVEYVFDTNMYLEQQEQADADSFELRALHEDESFIDIGDDVCQELAVRLPLKRIAPEFRGKSVEEVIDNKFLDDGSAPEGQKEETWAALKNIRFEDN